jgi:glycosyltransferase involved in cell wall biosynthesis
MTGSGEGTWQTEAPEAASVLPPPPPLPDVSRDPLVSVLIPNRNYERFLGEALEGLLRQTYARWEAIVCDDASEDGSVPLVERFAAIDHRIRLVRNDRAGGQARAFNEAYARSAGEIVCFLDADDTVAPERLERVVKGFAGSDAGMLVHPLMMFGPDGPIQRIPALTSLEEGWLGPAVARRGGRWRWVPTSGVSMRREIADLVFPMPADDLRISADTYFLVLAALLTPIKADEGVLGGYRLHGANGFARGRVEPDRARRAAENLRSVVDKVNGRLGELGRPAVLHVDDNLKYRDLLFQADLLDGATSRKALWPDCRRLVRSIRRDDMYGGVQKAWAGILYGVAVVLPTSARAGWLSWSLSGSKTKERLRRIVGGRRVRRRS